MVFESLLLQATPVESITALVVAISTGMGTIGALIIAVMNRAKVVTHDQKLVKIEDAAISVGRVATAFAQKTAEQQDEIKTVAEAVTSLSPDAKNLLAQKQKDIDYWAERARAADAQTKRLLAFVPPESQANAMSDLPREDLSKIKK
jgi:ATP-dependent DNA ligase